MFKWGRLHFFFDWSASSSRVSSSIREKNHLDLVDAFSDDGTRAPCHTHLNPYQRIENVPFLFTAFHLAIVMALFSPFFSPTNYRYCLAYNRIIGHHGLDHEYKRAVTSWKKLDWRNYTRVDGFEMIRFSHLAILLAICPSLSSFFSFPHAGGKSVGYDMMVHVHLSEFLAWAPVFLGLCYSSTATRWSKDSFCIFFHWYFLYDDNIYWIILYILHNGEDIKLLKYRVARNNYKKYIVQIWIMLYWFLNH